MPLGDPSIPIELPFLTSRLPPPLLPGGSGSQEYVLEYARRGWNYYDTTSNYTLHTIGHAGHHSEVTLLSP